MNYLTPFLPDKLLFLKNLTPWQNDSILLGILLVSLFWLFLAIKWLVIPFLERMVKKSKNKVDDFFWYGYVFPLIRFVPLLLSLLLGQFFKVIPSIFFEKTANILLIVIIMILLLRLIDDIVRFIMKAEPSGNLHLRGIGQAVKLLIYLFGGIFILAILINKTPWALLGGLGALTAVILLVFRDTILGLVAGIQLSVNQMVKIGDWIELPEHSTDGNVIDISLTSIKIENWDKSATFLPAYVLVSKSFKNWRTIQELGVRRIKRSIFINLSSVRFLSHQEITDFQTMPYLKNFLTKPEVKEAYLGETETSFVGKPKEKWQYTTAGLFRVYAKEYLLNHPKIRNDLTVLTRMMSPTPKGMGLQLYCFTNTADFLEYETVQSSIFEHLIAVAENFGLTIFQDPSNLDIKKILDAKEGI